MEKKEEEIKYVNLKKMDVETTSTKDVAKAALIDLILTLEDEALKVKVAGILAVLSISEESGEKRDEMSEALLSSLTKEVS